MQTQTISSPRCLSDRELVDRVRHLACHERRATACLVAHLAELDERRLYRAEGCSSLFTYCTDVLLLSEGAAYNRIKSARAVRTFPLILDRLADGSMNVTTVRLLARYLTPQNHQDLLDEAAYKSKRKVEEIVARIRPRPPVASSVRKVPAPIAVGGTAGQAGDPRTPAFDFSAEPIDSSDGVVFSGTIAQQDLSGAAGQPGTGDPTCNCPAAPSRSRPAKMAALAPDLYAVQFTADADTHRLLCQARELLRHQIPDGDAGAVIGVALRLLVDKLSRQKFGARRSAKGSRGERRDETENDRAEGQSPGSRQPSRHIPAEVRREVWKRDDGRCAFVSMNGRRCTERGRLEFHHVRPFAAGGGATVANIQLRCRIHNVYEAELVLERVHGFEGSARNADSAVDGGP